MFSPACLLVNPIQASQSATPENIVWNETVTIYTTTHTYDSRVIVHSYIWKYFCTGMSRFNNIFHQFISLPLWYNQNQVYSNINSKLLFPHKRWTCSLATQRNILFLLFASDLEDYIESFLLKSNSPTLAHNRYKYLHNNEIFSSHLFLCSLQLLPN